ncbi:MAG: cytochrome c biogenesis protein CcdA [Candidatus Zophobacter franzmannii]|nr:cytochrome c biogenesis protein CcdA [Candidatus Zophobacter franzmannii]
MIEIFTFLSNSIEGNLAIAFLGAFLWGVASILLSPCHLSGIPLIIGYINGQKQEASALKVSLLFSLGMLITIAIIGVITGLSGRIIGDLGRGGTVFLSVFFIFFGIVLLDIIKVPDIKLVNVIDKMQKGTSGAFLLGTLFGIGLGPCTFAFMAPMLGVVFQMSSGSLFKGIMMLVIFAIGHVGVIVFAGTFVQHINKFLKWGNSSGKVLLIRRICGVLVIIGGIYNLIKI